MFPSSVIADVVWSSGDRRW